MEFPSAIHNQCPQCNEDTLHKVLKGRLGKNKQLTLDCTIKCTECGFVHQMTINEKKLIQVPIIISTRDKSLRKTIELHPDEELTLDQEIIADEQNVVISSIEKGDKRVFSSSAKDISTIWSKRIEEDGKVRVKISVHKGPNTLSHDLWVLPDEEFFIGDVLRIKKNNVAIYKIKTPFKVVKYDSALARDIVRIYGRVIR
jgi:uncharacterized Zn finger protein